MAQIRVRQQRSLISEPEKIRKIVFGFKSGNVIQFGLERSDAFALDCGLIHAGRIKVADLLLFRAAVRADH